MYRGRAFLFMQEYKRALYDFSAAINSEMNYTYDVIKDPGSPLDSLASRLAVNYNFAGQCNHALG